MGRGRKKMNRKFQYLIAWLERVRVRILLTSYKADLAAQYISGIVTNYQNTEKRIGTRRAFSCNSSDSENL